MTPISKFEEQIAYTPLTGICVPRQRFFAGRGWQWRIVDVADLPAGDKVEP